MTAAHRTLAFGTRVRVCHSGCGLGMKVRTFQVLCFIVAIGLVAAGLVAIHSNATEDTLSATPNAIATANIDEQPPPSLAPPAMSDALPQRESLLSNDQKADFDA